jgi:HD-GYP domain-containing protein (c-di-GMP phosphodiesterase class II)
METPSKYIKENIDRCKILIQFILKDKFGTASLLETLGALVKHNSYTYVHSVQVSSYSILLHARMFKLSQDELLDIGVGGVFHDYGKVYIPPSVLEKPGNLTPMEYYLVKKHCEYGYDILKQLDTFSPVALGIVKHHHERMNGGGYPEGLVGDEISRSSKIAAIADVFSAMTTTRPYREGLEWDKALETMTNDMDGLFDEPSMCSFSAMIKGIS